MAETTEATSAATHSTCQTRLLFGSESPACTPFAKSGPPSRPGDQHRPDGARDDAEVGQPVAPRPEVGDELRDALATRLDLRQEQVTMCVILDGHVVPLRAAFLL
jgi:hypothetical protein